ncbi:hypothetical protein niasHT_040025 [Heterodera trifolii]|uniref:Uncharacterized protein n=1 Tax=Heterodera trifolii TaxID=157864 RepID=A0ABD2J2N3_9BILA
MCVEGGDYLDIWSCFANIDAGGGCASKDFAPRLTNTDAIPKLDSPWVKCDCEHGELNQSLGVIPPMAFLPTTPISGNTTENATVATDASGHHHLTALAFILPFVIGILPNLAMPFAANR